MPDPGSLVDSSSVATGSSTDHLSNELVEVFKTTQLSLVKEGDCCLTSDLTFFTLLQVTPYTMLSSGDSDDDSREIIGFPGLVCSHCNSRKFFTTSSEQLSGLLLTTSNHMQTCQSCPKSARNLITRFRGTHDKQMRQVLPDDHAKCMQHVWTRLVAASKKEKKKNTVKPVIESEENVCYLRNWSHVIECICCCCCTWPDCCSSPPLSLAFSHTLSLASDYLLNALWCNHG